jgi:hypothetical protein
VALIQNGEILSVNTPDGVIASFQHPLMAVKDNNMLHLLNDIKNFDGTLDAYPFGEYHHVVLKDGFDANAVKDWLQQHGYPQANVQAIRADIEDCFIALMKTEGEAKEP